eukprot:CAMPEP_0172629200 /NCGR_PEP_ID=MMETSP1068-20121228/166200_1 /TAXON_ID=35684 /ORGANISM="Pseudopedinella elastica, Strain CCMP716" /LENGTH=65 /DNA_ID=CAMNT_0013439655 /DNA_START=172 /DNA_END=365 /DNA_ORIENTATION=-
MAPSPTAALNKTEHTHTSGSPSPSALSPMFTPAATMHPFTAAPNKSCPSAARHHAAAQPAQPAQP